MKSSSPASFLSAVSQCVVVSKSAKDNGDVVPMIGRKAYDITTSEGAKRSTRDFRSSGQT